MQVRINTDITTEIISVAEAKNYCKVSSSYTTDDTLFGDMIKAARLLGEEYCNLSFKEKTYEAEFTEEELIEPVELPYGPHTSVESVTRYDSEEDATSLTLNTDYYKNGLERYKIKIVRSWTTGVVQTEYTYRIIYKAGYSTLPSPLKIAMFELIRDWYAAESYDFKITQSAKEVFDRYAFTSWL